MFDLLEAKGLADEESRKEVEIPSHLSHWFTLFRLLNLARRTGFNGVEPFQISDILSLAPIYPWVSDDHSLKCILLIDFEFRKMVNDRGDK